ncbi:MAG: C-GCAxxG-C-C family protein [Candidatus Heimdallarchaeota archaeon]
MSDNRVEEVLSCFQKGMSCSQAILSVYGQQFGVDRATCMKIASAFGGGIGGMGDVCGAVAGAIMAIGLKYDSGEVGTTAFTELPKSYTVAREFTQEFRERNGTVTCRELIDHDLLTVEDVQNAFKTGAFKNCPQFVKDAAEILEKIL